MAWGCELGLCAGGEYGFAANEAQFEANLHANHGGGIEVVVADDGGFWRGRETILLVEDEAFVREVAAEVLQSAGYRMLLAANADEAFEAYGKCGGAVHLLLADIVLPGMSGRELAARFAGLSPKAQILLMSGHAEQSVRERCDQCESYLAKPFTMLTLLRRVRDALDGPGLERDKREREDAQAHRAENRYEKNQREDLLAVNRMHEGVNFVEAGIEFEGEAGPVELLR